MHGKVFKYIEEFWSNLREFTFRNRTVLEVFFIVLYTLEQALLIWLTYKVDDPIKLSLLISIFAMIVLTTFSLHKLVMESRIRVLETQLKATYDEKTGLEEQTKKIIDMSKENRLLTDKIKTNQKI